MQLRLVVGTALGDRPAQAGAVDVLADDVRLGGGDVGRDHPGGAETRHPLGSGDLLGEPGPRAGAVRAIQPEQFDRHSFPRGVVRLVDDTLPTRTEPPAQPIATEVPDFPRRRCRVPHRDLPRLDTRHR